MIKEQQKQLDRVTIICVDCYNYGAAVSALQKCIAQVNAVRTVLLTNIPVQVDGIEIIQIPTITSTEEYSNFIVKDLYKYFDTDFVLIIQHDGWILSGDNWDDNFYNYDYIGASWLYQNGRNVGNGGFSLRSKKLQTILAEDKLIEVTHPEDQSICILYGDYLKETHGIKFATEEVADKFAYELREPTCQTFGFHGRFHAPYQPTVIIRRTAALGDCIILEPVLRYYFNKGYKVVVDMPRQFYALYSEHSFPVTHISRFDRGRIIPEKEINLDLAYEVKPNQNYLKSYFEFCGIEDYELTRPQLSPLVDGRTKLVRKYAVIHIDNRETPHRNTFGINWDRVRWHLEGLGYTVIQVGANEHEVAGIEINTSNIGFLKFVIAGCDVFIGVDSAPAGMAMAYNKPCILLFGSVNPEFIHPDLTNAIVIQQPCPKAGCWHQIGGVAGIPCVYDELKPPCCISSDKEVIAAINKFHKQ
jgi:hypothetical protein